MKRKPTEKKVIEVSAISSAKAFLEKRFSIRKVKLVASLILLIFLLGFFGNRYKDRFLGIFLAGRVNGQPIFKWELNQRLTSRYGKLVLENMIVEKVIFQEAQAKKIAITQEELDKAVEETKKRIGSNANLEDILSMQGMTMADFTSELRMEMLVKKLLTGEIAVSEEEVNSYLKENKKLLTATTEAEMKAEAKGIIEQEKLNEKLVPWVNALVNKATIVKFLN